MKHLNVLAMVVNLLIGVWAILYFQQKSRRFHDAGLRSFLGFLLIFNLFEFDQFILIYFFSNLTPAQLKNSEFLLKGISWPLRTLLLLGLYIFQYKIIAWQRERKLPRWLLPALFLFTAGLMAYFLLAMRFPAYMPESPLLNFWNLYLWPLIMLQGVWLARLLAESRRRPDPGHRRAGMAMAWLFFGHILLQVAIFLLGVMGLDQWAVFHLQAADPLHQFVAGFLAEILLYPLGRRLEQDQQCRQPARLPAADPWRVRPRAGDPEIDPGRQDQQADGGYAVYLDPYGQEPRV